MGYSGIKIPGHSGTDFKHKKVFTKYKKLLNHKTVDTNARREPQDLVPSYEWFSRIRVFIVIAFLCTFLLLLASYSLRITNIATHRSQVHTNVLLSASDFEKQHAAKLMYNAAKSYYASGALDYAQDEMNRVLKIYPTHLEAIQLMHKILIKQCENKNKHCDAAEAYQKYMSLQ